MGSKRKDDNKTNRLNEEYRVHYSSFIGSLIYLLNTRPDIAFAVTKLMKFMHRPGQEHFRALIHLLQYFRDNIHDGIMFYRKGEYSPKCDLLTCTGEKGILYLFGIHKSLWQDFPDTDRST